jgi:hypothetical protein
VWSRISFTTPRARSIALREGGVDLALDGAVLLGCRAGLLELDEMQRRGEDRERDEEPEAASEEGPPGGAVEEVGDRLFHRKRRVAPDIIQ